MTCCCDPPNPAIEIRRTITGCAANCITASTLVDVTIPALGASPGILWDLNCPSGWSPPAGSTTITDTWFDGGYSNNGGLSPQIAVNTQCDGDGDPDAIVTVRIQCGSLSTTQNYTLNGDCIGTYTRVGSSSTFPSTISVAYH